MQSWASRGSKCLLCPVRPLFHPVRRTFATTPILQKTKSKGSKPSGPRIVDKNGLARSRRIEKKMTARKNVVAHDFSAVVETILQDIRGGLQPSDPVLPGWGRMERYVMNACKMEDKNTKYGPLKQLKLKLLKSYLDGDTPGLRQELEYQLYAEDVTQKFSLPNLEQQKKAADLRFPAEWYGQARSMERTIHLHVGPTNSGKTYHALKRLESCKKGFYAGPLRLLAQEVFQRFKAQGVSCSLITGDDVQIPEGESPRIVSNTVEMANLGQIYEVGVIDEIQMIADPKRGWAWTRAVLGSRATELHLCGEARAVPLIRELAALTGDKLEIHRYERLNPLRPMEKSLQGDLKNLQKGDCLVAFSRVGIHALKADIEKTTGRRAAIVYGGLPAEIRTQQASLFNDPDNDYDYLVASDAIGMGLNLSCKRIIFETVIKRVPGKLVRLSVPEMKQIGGRAGRYRSAADTKRKGKSAGDDENVGFVTCLEDVDLPYIHEALSSEPTPITAAGIFPPEPVFHRFSSYFPQNVPFQYLIKRLIEISQVNPLFFLCDPQGQLENAEIIDIVDGLGIEDKLAFMAAPLHLREPSGRAAAIAFATCVAEHSDGRLLDIPALNLRILERPVSGDKRYLQELESLHKSVILYAWLSFRIGGIFTDRTLAAHVKELVEERMVRALTEFSENKKLRKDASLHRQIALQKQIQEQNRMMAEASIASIEEAETNTGDAPNDISDDVSEDVRDASDEVTDDVSGDARNGASEDTMGDTLDGNELERPVPKAQF